MKVDRVIFDDSWTQLEFIEIKEFLNIDKLRVIQEFKDKYVYQNKTQPLQVIVFGL